MSYTALISPLWATIQLRLPYTVLISPRGPLHPQSNGPRALLGTMHTSVVFRPAGEIRRETLEYLTNAQLMALEWRRIGDLRLELAVRGFLSRRGLCVVQGGPISSATRAASPHDSVKPAPPCP